MKYDARILKAVEDVNREQKRTLYNKMHRHFDGKLSGRTFAIWGLAFKPNTDDMREAPSRALIDELLKQGAKVRAYDPVAMEEAGRIYKGDAGFETARSAEAALPGADALAIVTEWTEFRSPDFDRIKRELKQPVIFDGRNLYDPGYLARNGITYYGIGRGRSVNAATAGG